MSDPRERQWAVIWDPDVIRDEPIENRTEICSSEEAARQLHGWYGHNRLVSRTVTYGEWEDAT